LDAALHTLERSLAESERVPQLERARTLLALGILRRQALRKKASREALNGALAVFEELGAPLWAEKARVELGRIGGRRAAGDELTASESRVAELAAAGRSNKEIAAELFMGVSRRTFRACTESSGSAHEPGSALGWPQQGSRLGATCKWIRNPVISRTNADLLAT
jgi:ATP/maltotriose-dependent transcriptional regulator MalT